MLDLLFNELLEKVIEKEEGFPDIDTHLYRLLYQGTLLLLEVLGHFV